MEFTLAFGVANCYFGARSTGCLRKQMSAKQKNQCCEHAHLIDEEITEQETRPCFRITTFKIPELTHMQKFKKSTPASHPPSLLGNQSETGSYFF